MTKISHLGLRGKAIPGRRRTWRSSWQRSKRNVLDGVDQGVQSGGSEYARTFLKDLAIGDARDGCQDHVTPVGQRSRPVVEMRASEDERRNQKGRGAGSKSLCDAILDQAADQDFFG